MKKGSGSGSPPIPLPGADPRTPVMALFDPPGGGPKIAILGALRCRARGGWGGSAHYPDPTAQSALRRAANVRRARPPGPRPFRACLASSSAKNSKKILFFFEEGCVCFGVDEWGCGNRLRRCGRRRRAGPPPPPLPEVCDARGGALTGPVPSRWRFSRHNLRGAAGGTPGLGPRLALANGLAPLAPATPLRGTAVPCFEGGALPHGYVPPTRAEEARAGPVAAMLPNRTGPCLACCAW